MVMNPQSLSESDAIYRIEQLGGKYDPESNLFIADQLLICETIAESIPTDIDYSDNKWMRNGSVKWNDNGSCKRTVKTGLKYTP